MVDQEHLCPRCMETWQEPSVPCPHCGFRWEEASLGKGELEPFALLNGRFLLGLRQKTDLNSFTYLALDIRTEKKIWVQEFYPAMLAERRGNTVVSAPENAVRFREGLQKFQRRAEEDLSCRIFFKENGTAYAVREAASCPDRKEALSAVPKSRKKWKWFLGMGIGCGSAVVCALLIFGKDMQNKAVSGQVNGSFQTAEGEPAADPFLEGIRANLQEDGTVWMKAEEFSYSASGENEWGSGLCWEETYRTAYTYSFTAEGLEQRILREFSGGDKSDRTEFLDTEGNVIRVADQDSETEYRRGGSGDTSWLETYEDGVLKSRTESKKDAQGRILRSDREAYDENGTAIGSENTVYTYKEDGSFQQEVAIYETDGEETCQGSEITTYDPEGNRIRFYTEIEYPDSSEERTDTYAYNEQGDLLRKQSETSQTEYNASEGDLTSHLRSTEEYAYEYDEQGTILKETRTSTWEDLSSGFQSEPSVQITEYTYDAWGNLLKEYVYQENDASYIPSCRICTYEQYREEDGIYVSTGTISGETEAELPDLSGMGEEPEKIEDASYQKALELIEELGYTAASQEDPETAWARLQAGEVDAAVVEVYLDDIAAGEDPEGLYFVAPPKEWMPTIDNCLTFACSDMEVCWRITFAFYDAGFYDSSYGTDRMWSSLVETLKNAEGRGRLLRVPESEKEERFFAWMVQYYDYWAESTGNTWELYKDV